MSGLKENRPGESCYVVGTPSLRPIFRMGIPLDEENPDLVILGFDTTLFYEKLSKACALSGPAGLSSASIQT